MQDGETIRSASAPSFSVLHEVRFVGDAEGGTVGKGDTVFVHVAHGSDVVSNIGVQVDRGFVATVSSGDGSDASFVAPDVAGAIEVFVNGDIAGIDDCDGFAACAFAGSFARVLRLNVTQ